MLTETRRKEGSGERGRERKENTETRRKEGRGERGRDSLSRAQNLAVRDVYFVLIEFGPQRAQECRAHMGPRWGCVLGPVFLCSRQTEATSMGPPPLPSERKKANRSDLFRVAMAITQHPTHRCSPAHHLFQMVPCPGDQPLRTPGEVLTWTEAGNRALPAPGSARSATHTRAASALLP